MGVLKIWVHSRACLEASIANGYINEKAHGFYTQYIDTHSYSNRRVWNFVKDAAVQGCVVEGQGKMRRLYAEEVIDIHQYMLENNANLKQERQQDPMSTLTHNLIIGV